MSKKTNETVSERLKDIMQYGLGTYTGMITIIVGYLTLLILFLGSFSKPVADLFGGPLLPVDLDPDDGPIHFPYRYLDGSDSWTDNYRNRVIDDIPASYVGSPIDMSFGVDPE